jgi:hypothetical protein
MAEVLESLKLVYTDAERARSHAWEARLRSRDTRWESERVTTMSRALARSMISIVGPRAGVDKSGQSWHLTPSNRRVDQTVTSPDLTMRRFERQQRESDDLLKLLHERAEKSAGPSLRRVSTRAQ